MNSDNILSVLDFLGRPGRTIAVLALNSKLWCSNPRFILNPETVIKSRESVESKVEILKYAVEKNISFDLEKCFELACESGHLEIVDLMIEKGADNCDNYGCKGHSNLQE